MDVILALVFISVMLVIGGLVFFFSRMSQGDFEHGDRLSLLPLDEDEKIVRHDHLIPPEGPFLDDKTSSITHIPDDNEESITP